MMEDRMPNVNSGSHVDSVEGKVGKT